MFNVLNGKWDPFLAVDNPLDLFADAAFVLEPFSVVPEIGGRSQGGIQQPVTIRRALWIPKKAEIPILIAAWEQGNWVKELSFEVWSRKYENINKILQVLEERNKQIPFLLNAHDIYIIEDLIDSIRLADVIESGRILDVVDNGWMVIDDN